MEPHQQKTAIGLHELSRVAASCRKVRTLSINEILGKSLARERKRSELVVKTPKVIVCEPTLSGAKKYYYTWLGKVRAWVYEEHGKQKRQMDYINAQTFRDGVVRYVTPELEQEISKIDADIKALQEQRAALLKDRFLWLHSVPYEEIRKVQEQIHEAVKD